MSHDLSKYMKIPLRDLIIAQKGKKPKKLSKIKFTRSLPYLDIEALERDNITQFADAPTSVKSNDGDVFIVWDGSRSGLVNKGQTGAVGSTLMCLTPLAIQPHYLFYFLKSKFNYLNKNTTGASIPHINPEIFYNIEVPVIPIESQIEVVKHIEEGLEIYNEDFKNISLELDRAKLYKESVLEQAVTGELTSNWRRKTMGDSGNHEVYNLTIPKSWQAVPLAVATSSIFDGDHQSPKKVTTGIPFILISNIHNGVIDFSNTLKVSEKYFDALKEFRKPQKGDVLLTIVGSIGNVVLLKKDSKFCFQRHIALIKASENCLPEFLYYQMLSNFFQKQALERSKGVAQLTLNLAELRDLKVLLPTLDEQKEILSILKPLLEDVDTILKDYAISLSLNDDLRSALVESAFNENIFNKNLKSVNADWQTAFLVQRNEEKERKQIELLNIRKKNRILRESMKESESLDKSLISILKNSGKQSLPIEEVWQQSLYYQSGNIEAFYEEIESKGKAKNNTDEISWEFANDNKDQVILKIINHVD